MWYDARSYAEHGSRIDQSRQPVLRFFPLPGPQMETFMDDVAASEPVALLQAIGALLPFHPERDVTALRGALRELLGAPEAAVLEPPSATTSQVAAADPRRTIGRGLGGAAPTGRGEAADRGTGLGGARASDRLRGDNDQVGDQTQEA